MDILKMVEEFKAIEATLDASEYPRILRAVREIAQKARQGLISDEEAKSQIDILTKELEGSQIILLNESDFREFSMALGQPYQIDHEIQHSLPYKKVGVSSLFIWTKLSFGELGPIYIPSHCPYGEKYEILTNEEKEILRYISLKSVPDPSDRDDEMIKELEERCGHEYLAQKMAEFAQQYG